MQNANNGLQQENVTDQNNTPPTPNAQDVVKESAQEVAKTAEQKTAEIGDKMKDQVQNVGEAAGQQMKDLGKEGVSQLQNIGQAGVSQVGSAVGKVFSTVNDQKANQPPVTKDEKIYATIAYIPFVAIISIIIKPDSAYVRLHSKQGLLLAILFFFVGMMAAIVSLFGIIGQLLAFVLGLVPLACMIIGVYSMYLAFSGFWWKMPVLGSIADIIPVEMMAKVSKENITGQVGVAKTDYDNRADTLKQEKQEAITPVEAVPTTTPAGNATPVAGEKVSPAPTTAASNETAAPVTGTNDSSAAANKDSATK